MDRTEFEALRDLRAKTIEGDVCLALSPRTEPLLTADDIAIRNSVGVDLLLNATYLPRRKAFKINVHVRGIGPICRVEVNGPEHPGATRTHKHALKTSRCPGRNLHHDVQARPDLKGQSLRDVWRRFCDAAAITHRGELICEGIDPSAEIL